VTAPPPFFRLALQQITRGSGRRRGPPGLIETSCGAAATTHRETPPVMDCAFTIGIPITARTDETMGTNCRGEDARGALDFLEERECAVTHAHDFQKVCACVCVRVLARGNHPLPTGPPARAN
ncbi:hypothetical protein IscW_ISCW008086, partial [Ixodes scapularis]